MTVILDRINSAPLSNSDFSYEFASWVSTMIDTLNEIIANIEGQFNSTLIAPSYTMAEIAALAVNAPNGSLYYATDHVPPVLVAKVNGVLVQLSTAAYP